MAATFAGTPWVGAAVVNTVLAAVVLLVRRRPQRRPTLTAGAAARLGPPWWHAYLPAAAVLLLALAAVVVSRVFVSGASYFQPSMQQIAWVLWIPFVEEIVFRLGTGAFFRRLGGKIWGSYFSAVVFAVVHTRPTISRIIAMQVGVPLGPLLLGFCCEALFLRYGRLAPLVLFHAACNATVVIFMVGDGRWLDWLGFLYM